MWKAGGEAVEARRTALVAMEAAVCIGQIMVAPGLDRSMIQDHHLHDIVALLRFHAADIVVPLLNGRPSGGGDPPVAGGAQALTAMVNHLKPVLVAVRLLVAQCEAIVEFMRMDDSVLVEVTQSALGLVFIETSDHSLQMAATRLLQAVYTKHKDQRVIIMEDIVGCLSRLSYRKASLRTFDVAHPPHKDKIQVFSALVLHLLQGSVPQPVGDDASADGGGGGGGGAGAAAGASGPTKGGDGAGGDDDDDPMTSSSGATPTMTAYDAMLQPARTFIRRFLERAVRKDEEMDYQKVFRYFVEDVLTVLPLPDWPAAEPVLRSVVNALTHILPHAGSKTEQPRSATTLALDLIGKVLYSIEAARGKITAFSMEVSTDTPTPTPTTTTKKTRPGTPAVNPDGRPGESSEETIGCECGIRVNDGSFMLDCDSCHQWYHGACVAVTLAAAQTSKSWLCDRCQIRRQVGVQRQLLAKSSSSSSPSLSSSSFSSIDTNRLLRQLVVNTLSKRDGQAEAARRFWVTRWTAEAESVHDDVMAGVWKAQWSTALDETSPSLSDSGAARVSLEVRHCVSGCRVCCCVNLVWIDLFSVSCAVIHCICDNVCAVDGVCLGFLFVFGDVPFTGTGVTGTFDFPLMLAVAGLA